MSKRRYIAGKPVIRCSELAWFIDCPGANTLADAVGRERDDEDEAWDGQWAHHKGASILIHEHGALPPEGGLEPLKLPPSYEPPDFMEWVVNFYVAHVLEDAGSDRAIGVEAELLHEFPRFWLSGHSDVFTVDADATELNFDDLKAGINVVDAADCNWQVLGYATLFKLLWPSLRKIRGRIIQPRLKEEVAPRITGVTIDENGCFADHLNGEKISDVTVDGLAAGLEQKINEALDNPRLLNSGVKQCRWCPAKLRCPALDADQDAMKLELTDELLQRVKETPEDEVLARICVAGKMLGPRFEKAKDLLKARLELVKLIELPDGTRLFLIDGLGRREFMEGKPGETPPVGQAWEKLADALDAELAYGCLEIGIEAAEKALAKQFKMPHKSSKPEKMDGKKMLAQLIGHLITRKPQKNLQIV